MSWCRKELSRALGSVVEDDLLDYLVSMEGEKDVREYLQDMLNQLEAAEIQVFMNEFFRHWSPPSHEALSPCNSQLVQEPLVRPHREQLVLYSKEVYSWNCCVEYLFTFSVDAQTISFPNETDIQWMGRVGITLQ